MYKILAADRMVNKHTRDNVALSNLSGMQRGRETTDAGHAHG